MRKSVLIPVVVLTLIALCIGGWFLLVHRRANAGLRSAEYDVRVGLSSAEYDVLSAWITTKASELTSEVKDARKISILGTTEPDELHSHMIPWAETAKFLQEKAPTLQTTTLEAFQNANRGQAIVRRSFHIAIDYQIVDRTQIEPLFKEGGGSWPVYYKQFPDSQGVLTFARVGFNTEGTQAVIYWSNNCGELCGAGGYVVMEKQDGRWSIGKEIEMWIS